MKLYFPSIGTNGFPNDFPQKAISGAIQLAGLGAKTRLLLLKFDDGGFQTLPDEMGFVSPKVWIHNGLQRRMGFYGCGIFQKTKWWT